MTIAIAPLTDFRIWASSDLLVIILLVLGAALLTRLANWLRGLVVRRIDARSLAGDELVRSEAAKHRYVFAEVLTWCALAVVYVITAVLIVQRLGVPLAGLVAPAALISAALGLGLQGFVKDIGAGFFITGERQYGFGDVVRISVSGVSEPAVGTVEEVTLRVTRIRSLSVRATIWMVARTLPGLQFDVGREIRARVATAFLREGITVAAELDTGDATGDPTGDGA